MHIAETREQAYRDVEYGIEEWFRYFQKTAAFPQMAVEGGDVKEMIEFVNEAGIGAIGTLEDARAQVQRLGDQSGGFGGMLLLGHEWANPQATKRSWELIAEQVMPHFQGGEISHAQGRRWTGHSTRAGKREDYAAAADAGHGHHDRALPAGTRCQGQVLKDRFGAMRPAPPCRGCSLAIGERAPSNRGLIARQLRMGHVTVVQEPHRLTRNYRAREQGADGMPSVPRSTPPCAPCRKDLTSGPVQAQLGGGHGHDCDPAGPPAVLAS